tara:strand:- start:4126 stop:5136 length:1011 start_codon:yes stop_codon:yes gene_type:complete
MHIFYIHSHITFVIAQLFILEHSIHKSKIRYITSRGYKLNSDSYDITWFYSYLELASKFNKVFKLKQKIKAIDRDIRLLANNRVFCVYLPQFNHSLFQIIGTHNLCESLVLVEEGITSYKLDEKLYKASNTSGIKFLSQLFSKRFILNNKHYNPLPEDKFKYAICMHKQCFPFIDKKRVITTNSDIISNYKSITENGDIIFVLDSFKERTKTSDEDYLIIIKKTLNLLELNNNKFFIKFHPEQDKFIRKKTLNFIKKNFKFETIICLNDSCILEFEFLKSKNLTVLGMHTSLLYYAKRFGHNVLSSIRITSKSPKIDVYINHIMDEVQKNEYKSYE